MKIKENKINNFMNWLSSQGSEIMQCTNEYEILRYKYNSGVGIIYKGKKGLSVNNSCVNEAWECFIKNKKWNGKGKPTKRKSGSKRKMQLINRDGKKCFYCFIEFDFNELTIEHFVPLIFNGPDRLENLVLSCSPCNSLAGRLSVIEKVLLRDKNKGKNEY